MVFSPAITPLPLLFFSLFPLCNHCSMLADSPSTQTPLHSGSPYLALLFPYLMYLPQIPFIVFVSSTFFLVQSFSPLYSAHTPWYAISYKHYYFIKLHLRLRSLNLGLYMNTCIMHSRYLHAYTNMQTNSHAQLQKTALIQIHIILHTGTYISIRAVETHFKKPRFLGFLINLKNLKS